MMTTAVFANSASAVLGRSANRKGKENPAIVTTISIEIAQLFSKYYCR